MNPVNYLIISFSFTVSVCNFVEYYYEYPLIVVVVLVVVVVVVEDHDDVTSNYKLL